MGNWPIFAWEAMMHGVAPVTYRCRGLGAAGFLKHMHNAIIYKIGDMKSTAIAIQKLAEDPKLMKKYQSRL